jgi:multidrug efflux pump subunit AcrA (membrane-fusion protein)
VLAHSGDDDDSEPADEDIDSPRTVAPETARFINLKTEAASTVSLSDSIALSGRVGALPDSRRKVCARFGGVITAVHKQIGELVKSGDILIELESPDIARYRLEAHRSEAEHQRLLLEIEKTKVEGESFKRTVAVSELQHQAAQKELERLQNQSNPSPMAALELANRQESVTRTAGDLRILKFQLQLSESTIANLTKQDEAVQAALKLQRSFSRDEDNILHIPAGGNGVVTLRSVTIGEWVQQGQTLFELEDRTSVQVEVDVPEALVSRVAARKSDAVTVRAQGDLAPTINGKTRTLGPSIDPVRRTATLYVSAENLGNALLDGARVSVSVATSEPRDVLVVPRAAVLSRGPRRFVFIKNGEQFQSQNVATGISSGDWIEVKAGLAPGDTIVVQGAAALLHLRPAVKASR